MTDIKDQKLLYHLTLLSNLPSILEHGLKPRCQLNTFDDIADQNIIANREIFDLDQFVPFHWFTKNPFDGRVQCDINRPFVLIAVYRTLAKRENWRVIPQHPLANTKPEMLDYEEGMATIDWEKMNERDYRDDYCKSVCMAECLSPRVIMPSDFALIYAPTSEVEEIIESELGRLAISVKIDVNKNMFIS